MSQPNLLELAKQGHPKAIESLINRQMQPKGITAKVALKNNCLHIMLEAAQPPDQQALVPVIRKGVTNLGVASIEILKIYGKQAGEQVPLWSQQFELGEKSSPSANSENIETPIKELSLKEKAKQGDVEAITKLLNVALLSKNITSKATLKDGYLSVMLESAQVPDEEASTRIVTRELSNLKVETIKTVKVYGQQINDEFPNWSQDITFQQSPRLVSSLNNTQDSSLVPSKKINNDSRELDISQINWNNQAKNLGIIGSVILFIGVFCPVISIPMSGEINYLNNGRGDGIILIFLALLSLYLTIKEAYKWLWFPAFGSLAVISLGIILFQIRLSEIKTQMDRQLAGNPFRGIADTLVQSVQMKWGWAILLLGVGLIIAAAAIKEKENIQESGYYAYFSELLFLIKRKL